MLARIAIVTGASSGIGKAIVRELIHKGFDVAMLSRSQDKMLQGIAEIGLTKNRLIAVSCDLSQPAEISCAIARIRRELGVASVLINNAGFGGDFLRIEHIPLDVWNYTFAVNVRAAFSLAQQVLPAMIEQQFGRIINIASILGLKAQDGSAAYTASKHALIGLTRALAAEHGSDGITCNAICPGYIDTPMLSQNHRDNLSMQAIPMQRIGRSEEIAKLVACLSGEDSFYLNGSIITADGGLLSKV